MLKTYYFDAAAHEPPPPPLWTLFKRPCPSATPVPCMIAASPRNRRWRAHGKVSLKT